MKKTRIVSFLLIAIMACSICAFAMGPPPAGAGGPPPDMGGAPAAGEAPNTTPDVDNAGPAVAPGTARTATGPATGGVAIAYALFSLCAAGTAVSIPLALKNTNPQ